MSSAKFLTLEKNEAIHSSIIIITPIFIIVVIPLVRIIANSDVRLLPAAQSPPSKLLQGLTIYLCFILYPAFLAVKVPRLHFSLADALEASTEAALSGSLRAPMRQGTL
ncbi:hypothetical protein VP1G_10605 [Cytospora mali]|uniref:Uncharacterized protein n=1 Tax=Cytospora mali TaxID=578113 RepID=A0A194UPE1_CYTMA|nr:hypothetical protein VP1G_10605 [Valsa mali var. pyri (nom. inval.)]